MQLTILFVYSMLARLYGTKIGDASSSPVPAQSDPSPWFLLHQSAFFSPPPLSSQAFLPEYGDLSASSIHRPYGHHSLHSPEGCTPLSLSLSLLENRYFACSISVISDSVFIPGSFFLLFGSCSVPHEYI